MDLQGVDHQNSFVKKSSQEFPCEMSVEHGVSVFMEFTVETKCSNKNNAEKTDENN